MQITDDYIEKQINKAAVLGLETYRVAEPLGTCMYIIMNSSKDRKCLNVYIPSDVQYLYDRLIPDQYNQILRAASILKVMGGSGLKITRSMFENISTYRLEQIDITELDTQNVENMESMFQCCTITILGLEKLNTSKVVNMSHMFDEYQAVTGATNLINFDTVLDASNFDTHNVTIMESMFQRVICSIKGLENFDTSNVKDMSRMFAEADIRSDLAIPFKTNSLDNVYEMFSLTKVRGVLDLSDFKISNADSLNYSEIFCQYITKYKLNADTGKIPGLENVTIADARLQQVYDDLAKKIERMKQSYDKLAEKVKADIIK